MPQFLLNLLSSVRRWALYSSLLTLVLSVFVWTGLRGYRLLGDDNESGATELTGPPRAGGHGGYVHGFNHK
jgi:hypothetical protein